MRIRLTTLVTFLSLGASSAWAQGTVNFINRFDAFVDALRAGADGLQKGSLQKGSRA